jgi:molybdopterin-biosynthesis enzyme MoeA-like protein
VPAGERSIVVFDAGESVLLPLMNDVVARFPRLRLFSLPSFLPNGGRRLELGVKGDARELDAAMEVIEEGVRGGGWRWERTPEGHGPAPGR